MTDVGSWESRLRWLTAGPRHRRGMTRAGARAKNLDCKSAVMERRNGWVRGLIRGGDLSQWNQRG